MNKYYTLYSDLKTGYAQKNSVHDSVADADRFARDLIKEGRAKAVVILERKRVLRGDMSITVEDG